mgnify:CR=1 FL=1
MGANGETKNKTQFIVAVIGMSFLGVAAMAALVLQAFHPEANLRELTFLLVGGLLSTASMASAWLFRVNGSK